MSWAERSIFAKMVVIFAIAFGIGLGLCGLDFLLAAHDIGRSGQQFGQQFRVGPLDILSLVVMIVSGLVLVVTVVVWVLWTVIRSIRNDQQRLFDDKDR